MEVRARAQSGCPSTATLLRPSGTRAIWALTHRLRPKSRCQVLREVHKVHKTQIRIFSEPTLMEFPLRTGLHRGIMRWVLRRCQLLTYRIKIRITISSSQTTQIHSSRCSNSPHSRDAKTFLRGSVSLIIKLTTQWTSKIRNTTKMGALCRKTAKDPRSTTMP
jgi:hypothetical protein